ncbi:Cof-type HAD-IIB family hydrolase [Lactobacillus delbrueckii subsp. bulgaricus]|uniref:Cof-type HAD-IIB family hydrolase n=1 Tax=Lactobacillus delbrueckii TaxID=1584 RepID=UPI0011C6FF94|nr:HAD family phosphatase [Lactobacillus delbrueckii]
MMIKLIASDLDETLLGPGSRVVEENLRAIKKCQELGIKFVPATGRGFYSLRQTLEELGQADQAGQYTICYNGGAVFENKGPRLISFTEMDGDLVEEIFKRGQELGLGMHIYTEDQVYGYQLTQEEIDFCQGRADFAALPGGDLTALRASGARFAKILYVDTDFPRLKKLRKDLADFEKVSEMSFSSNRYLEFNPPKVNKGTGLKKLCQELGYQLDETMAIGDSFNDLAMIKAAGTGVGVANVSPEMRADCDKITEKTFDQGAVAEAIGRWVLPDYE